jgi:uncharacterized protein YijF (DUF1287 family)
VLPCLITTFLIVSQSESTQVTGLGNRQRVSSKLAAAAIERTHHHVRYVSDYVPIPYPGGDVPSDTGVCTDEVIRSYRAVGIDLQKEVHEDMMEDFDAYPHGRQPRPERTSITAAFPT